MKESSLSDSSDDLYYTATTDIFDFSADTTFIDKEVELATSSSRSLFLLLISFLKKLAAFALVYGKLTLELSVFAFVLLTYLRRKVVQFVYLLDVSKDQLVSGLMWRRGLLFRPATHGGVIVMVALALVAGGLFTRGQIAAQDLTTQELVLKGNNTTETIVPTNRPRSEVVTYQVASADTVSNLAVKFGVSAETIKWANDLDDNNTIHPGDTLKIPPVTGVVYKVKSGDTLDSVAKVFTADKQTIVDFPFNYIDETLTIKVGQTLYVPNGSIPQPPAPVIYRAPSYPNVNLAGSGILSWPVPRMISQYFSWFHTAIDLDDPYGTPIYAAAAGTVTEAKQQAYSFGWYCKEDIGNGYEVWYAHMSVQACYIGEQVSRGQYIGNIGTTGRATGPHLHLEVHHYGTPVDPLTLLP